MSQNIENMLATLRARKVAKATILKEYLNTFFPWAPKCLGPTFKYASVRYYSMYSTFILTSIIIDKLEPLLKPSRILRSAPWITKPLQDMRNKRNWLFKNYKRDDYKPKNKCQDAVDNAKLVYLRNLGNKLNKSFLIPVQNATGKLSITWWINAKLLKFLPYL